MTYILPTGNHKDCWLVDCGDLDVIIEEGWHVIGVLITHSHYDHIYGLNNLVLYFPNVSIYTNKETLFSANLRTYILLKVKVKCNYPMDLLWRSWPLPVMTQAA